jgi:pSer/pThr/pTyr-binding forkhead associated (FHA) protein
MISTQVYTKTDPAADEWNISDDVFRLRLWGTDSVRILPLPPVHELTVGAAEACALRLDDPTGCVSQMHARLVRSHNKWLLRDIGSKNGLRVDGARRSEIVLEPGLEIAIGGMILIAESPRSVELRSFLARLLGWRSERVSSVDYALRSVRLAAARRLALVLSGDGDLVPIAHAIHRRSRGVHRPFVVCDPRRRSGEATVRSPESYTTGAQALVASRGGTLCMRTRRLPPDFRQTLDVLLAPSSQAQLVVCAETPKECELYRVSPIAIPSLARRAGEIDRIIDEYAEDAINELDTPDARFLSVDRAWVREHASSSLPEIEKATLRMVALRASPTLGDAAKRLGMAPVSLSRWIGRRSMPMDIAQ